jgi:monoamine oxidase
LSSVPALGATGAGVGTTRDPRIVIVGAGLAGLTTAYELRKAGIVASIVEGAPRAGGRCLSERRAFSDNQIAERGGELIDTAHDVLIDLAIELGLPLDDLAAAETAGLRSIYHFGGTLYDEASVTRDLRKLWPRLARDARVLGDAYPTFRRYTPAQARLDRLSCAQWIDTRVDGGRRSRFGQLLANAYTEELGADPDDISAISVVGLLAGTPQDRFSPYEESDQRYHIRGGNDQLVERMALSIGDNLRTGTRLIALARAADGRVRLTVQRDQAISDELADHVVLAVPFTMLRQVDLRGAGFTSRKRKCIRELGMGRNTKLQLQFTDRPWLNAGANGETRVDGSYQVSWEVTRGQGGRAGILNFFSGGSAAARAGEGMPEERARDALADLQQLLPGIGTSWNGRVIRNAWDRYPWTQGSYSLLKPGQYTELHGIEDTIEGRVHFAGEQSSMLYAGYMNGALESGQRAAREIIAALRSRKLRSAA